MEIDRELIANIQACAELAQQRAGSLMVLGADPPGRAEAEAAYRAAVGYLNQALEALQKCSPT
ncbi:MAG: hypothetical protein AB7S38_14660 [Vulcanimicrobiota bacterium]